MIEGGIPVIKLFDCLLVPIQGELGDASVGALKTKITDRINETGARYLIIDISGVQLMDSYLTKAFRDLARVACLMGVRTVLCGMGPLIAATLVEMDLLMDDIETFLNLEAALESIGIRHTEKQDTDDDARVLEYMVESGYLDGVDQDERTGEADEDQSPRSIRYS